jgi:hypothetical protein
MPDAESAPLDRAARWPLRLAWGQGAFFLVSGIWPILHMSSFVAVTGPKVDLWLVKTVGSLLATFGAGLLIAARRKQISAEIKFLGAAFPLVLAVIDINYVARGVIDRIYLLDAAVELVIAIAWLVSGRAVNARLLPRPRAVPQPSAATSNKVRPS